MDFTRVVRPARPALIKLNGTGPGKYFADRGMHTTDCISAAISMSLDAPTRDLAKAVGGLELILDALGEGERWVVEHSLYYLRCAQSDIESCQEAHLEFGDSAESEEGAKSDDYGSEANPHILQVPDDRRALITEVLSMSQSALERFRQALRGKLAEDGA